MKTIVAAIFATFLFCSTASAQRQSERFPDSVVIQINGERHEAFNMGNFVELLRIDKGERRASSALADGNGAIEAGLAAGVTAGPGAAHLHLQPERILVAIRAHLDHAHGVAALLALAPKALSRSRPDLRFPGLDRAG